MAKLKNTPQEGPIVEQVVVSDEEVVPVEEKAEEQVEAEAVAEPNSKEETKEVELPEYVDKILKTYPNYEELAIDHLGGVYTKDTKHLSKDNAILYQNPYYKQ